MKVMPTLGLSLIWGLAACGGPSPADVWASPDDIWTWQVERNYQPLAHCLADALNSAPVHSWFNQAPRPVTSFVQRWQADTIILESVDPFGVEQVSIRLVPASEQSTHVTAAAKNLEALGGGAPMYFVRASVDFCSHR